MNRLQAPASSSLVLDHPKVQVLAATVLAANIPARARMDKERTTLRLTKPCGLDGGIAPVAHNLREALVPAQRMELPRMELPDSLVRAWQHQRVYERSI